MFNLTFNGVIDISYILSVDQLGFQPDNPCAHQLI